MKKSYQKFVTETADMKGAAKLMRSVKRDSFVPPTLLSNDGQYTSSKEDTVRLLMDTHFPGSLDAQLELEQYYNEIIKGNKPKVKLQKIPWIDSDRVRRAIASFSDFKARWHQAHHSKTSASHSDRQARGDLHGVHNAGIYAKGMETIENCLHTETIQGGLYDSKILPLVIFDELLLQDT